MKIIIKSYPGHKGRPGKVGGSAPRSGGSVEHTEGTNDENALRNSGWISGANNYQARRGFDEFETTMNTPGGGKVAVRVQMKDGKATGLVNVYPYKGSRHYAAWNKEGNTKRQFMTRVKTKGGLGGVFTFVGGLKNVGPSILSKYEHTQTDVSKGGDTYTYYGENPED